MSNFKLFWKIIEKRKFVLLLQFLALFGVSFFLARTATDNLSSPDPISVQMAIIDRDNSATSQGLVTFLGDQHELVELPDDSRSWQNDVFYGQTRYVLIIPEGFGENPSKPLQHLKNPDFSSPYFINFKIEDFVATLNNYRRAGFSPEDSLASTLSDLSTTVPVTLLPTTAAPAFSYFYFRFLPITLLSAIILSLGSILQAFQHVDLNRRLKASAHSERKFHRDQIIGCLSIGSGIWLLFLAIPLIVAPREILTQAGVLRMLNSFPLLLLGIALANVFGLFIKSKEGIYSNLFSLMYLLALPTGILADSWNTPENLLMVGRLLPLYWYSRSNDMVFLERHYDFGIFWEGLIIQIAYAVAILSVALVISKERNIPES